MDMHAIEVAETGGPEVMTYVDKPEPTPGPGEVVIKADSIGVNFIDTYFRSGSYPHRLPFVLGGEVAGTVAAVGDGVRTPHIGQRVACADAVGAYDGIGKTTFDASLAVLALRGTLALFGASSGPVPPVDPQRLNAAGSVYLTRPFRPHFMRSRDEFEWRTGQLFDAMAAGTVTVSVSGRYALKEAAQVHRDLQERKTVGSVVLTR
jgi:NADPH:quinone reductase-like Zn-dependent oxidoreductase